MLFRNPENSTSPVREWPEIDAIHVADLKRRMLEFRALSEADDPQTALLRQLCADPSRLSVKRVEHLEQLKRKIPENPDVRDLCLELNDGLKRGLTQKAVVRAYRYVDEQTFRFNERGGNDGTVQQGHVACCRSTHHVRGIVRRWLKGSGLAVFALALTPRRSQSPRTFQACSGDLRHAPGLLWKHP